MGPNPGSSLSSPPELDKSTPPLVFSLPVSKLKSIQIHNDKNRMYFRGLRIFLITLVYLFKYRYLHAVFEVGQQAKSHAIKKTRIKTEC